MAVGAVYPPTSTIREAAVLVGAAVAAAAEEAGVAAMGACRGGVEAKTGKHIPSLDGGDEQACVNWEACIRDYMKTCL